MAESSELFEHVYDRLRTIAQRHLRNQPLSATLQPTALIHELYVRLARSDPSRFNDREHFLAVASTAMRQIVIDQARRRKTAKRGGDFARITLTDALNISDRPSEEPLDVLVIDDLITRLAELSPRQARVVELRVFAGLTVSEVATVLHVSLATIEKDWRRARAWMGVQLSRAMPT